MHFFIKLIKESQSLYDFLLFWHKSFPRDLKFDIQIELHLVLKEIVHILYFWLVFSPSPGLSYKVAVLDVDLLWIKHEHYMKYN